MSFVEQIIDKAKSRLVALPPTAPAIEAAALFRDGAEMVVACFASGKIAGVITKSDMMRTFVTLGKLEPSLLIEAVMRTDVASCLLDDRLEDVWKLLRERDYRHLSVVDRLGCLVGVLNARDVLSGLLADSEIEEELLRHYVMGIGYQ